MAISKTCDVCGETIDEVVCKLFISPRNGKRSIGHNDYTASADIGPCCLPLINKQITFRRRVKRAKSS